jgi:hypothetical protein
MVVPINTVVHNAARRTLHSFTLSTIIKVRIDGIPVFMVRI